MKKVLNFIAMFCVSISVFGGSLEPSGMPAGTMKPLDQVEPRTAITSLPLTITQSGSYYLSKNLTATGTAIMIQADNVTIDLCGFTLTGPDTSGYGILMNGRKNVEVRNGTIKDFGYWGFCDNSSAGRNHRIIDVIFISNGYYGIAAFGTGNLVQNCTVVDTSGPAAGMVMGINVGEGSIVTDCKVSHNTSVFSDSDVYGIYAGIGSNITDNIVFKNGSATPSKVYGISSGNSTIRGNTVYNNGNGAAGDVQGINASAGSTVIGNSVTYNGQFSGGTRYGIYLGGYNLVDQNTCYLNGIDMHIPTTSVKGNNVAPIVD